jgi:hypothetical protein
MEDKWVKGILVVIILVLALGSPQLYPKALESVEVECEESEWIEDYHGSQFNREGGTENWTDAGNTKDEEIAWIKDQIEKWREDPELQIGGTSIHRTEKTVVFWVYEGTPENERLHGTMIDGWKIIVAEAQKPPLAMGILALSIGVVVVIAFILILIYKKFREGY